MTETTTSKRGRATHEAIAQYERYVMNTYVRTPLVLTRGKGSRVWDVEGREYVDLFPGWGVSGLGHNHPFVSDRKSTRLNSSHSDRSRMPPSA